MSQLVVSLIQPVVRALALAGVTQKELLSGAIEHTDLSWQAPPLRCDAMLHGAPLSQYFESRPPRLYVRRLYDLWVEGMTWLRLAPYKVCDEQGFRALSYCMPNATSGERRYWITRPEGFPRVDEYSGVRLSLEIAFLISISQPTQKIVDDADNFYVVTEEGLEIGVRDGLPIVEYKQWDLPVSGMVQDLLHISRGESFIGCDYDIIAKLRSVAYARRDIVQDFEGVDVALQALRILADGKHLVAVHSAVTGLDQERKVNNHRLGLVQQALDISNVMSISDRKKVLAIRALLVPEILSPAAFKQKLFSSPKIPPALSARSMEKLRTGLHLLYQAETLK